jgi:hypothetical protein
MRALDRLAAATSERAGLPLRNCNAPENKALPFDNLFILEFSRCLLPGVRRSAQGGYRRFSYL